MAIAKGKANAGQGGKRGHSNQDHWYYTEAIKEAARKQRRLDAKIEIKDGLDERDENRSPTVREGLTQQRSEVRSQRSEVRDQRSEITSH